MSRNIVHHPHVAMSEMVLGGSPHVAGARVPVRRLWVWHKGGASAETLVKRYPNLGPAAVFDALAFCYDNQALVEEDLERERQALAGAERQPPDGQLLLSAAKKRRP